MRSACDGLFVRPREVGWLGCAFLGGWLRGEDLNL